MKLSELMLSASLTLYGWLLLLYPRSFRREYGELMLQVFRDLITNAIRQQGVLGAIEVWWRVAAELLDTLWEQHSIAGSFYFYRYSQQAVLSALILLLFLIAGWLYLT